MRHILGLDDLTHAEVREVLALAADPAPPKVLDGKGMALLFEKPSARTRNSMEMAVTQLGGHPIAIRGEEVGLDVRETSEDVARTLGCFHAAIGARVFDHTKLERMVAADVVPIVNMLSDVSHPLQGLADGLTMAQYLGAKNVGGAGTLDLAACEGAKVAWIGDGNNVARSLALVGAALGMTFAISSPDGYRLNERDRKALDAYGVKMTEHDDPADAVEGAAFVHTDTWTSMGQEDEKAQRQAAFADFGVDEALMAAAGPDAAFMHCLPAYRGVEVTAEVIDGQQSLVWAQAENRMHAARGALAWLLGAS